jgi:hypothetical protein
VEGVVSNKTLFALEKSFAENVSKMMNFEVFGIGKGCSKSWNCLYKDYLILDVLYKYKTKCLNFCVPFDTIQYNGVFYLVIDNLDFIAQIGDEVSVDSESFDFLDVDYVIQNLSQGIDIEEGLYSYTLGLGYSTRFFIVDLGNTLTDITTGYVSLTESIKLSFDDRELSQEDLDCLIKKIC